MICVVIKKIKALVLAVSCAAISLVGGYSAAANEAEEKISVSWCGDYSKMELIATIMSPVMYKQQFSLCMYPAGIDNPSIDDYCRMTEVTVKGNEKTEVCFKIADDLTEEDGKYKLLVQGNGYRSEILRSISEVFVITPGKVSGADGIIGRFNSATEKEVADCISEVKDALQLLPETNADREQKRIKKFLSCRDNDYNGKFTTLEDVKKAWKFSDLAAYVSDLNANSDGLKEKIGTNSIYVTKKIDLEDYKKYEDEICKNVFNNGNTIDSIKSLNRLISDFTVVSVINNSGIDSMGVNLEKYFEIIGVSQASLKTIKNMSSSNANKVYRQLYQKNFTGVEQILSNIDKAITTVLEKDNGSDGSAGGGSRPKAGLGGGVTLPITGSNESQQNNTQLADYSDCSKAHWAYEYVDSLRKRGIVNGYNGCFYPDRVINRQEFIKMIVCAGGLFTESSECEFGDVNKSDWYYRYIASAKNEGIINGVDDVNFGVNQPITRMDAAVIAGRLLEKFGKLKATTQLRFTDAEAIADYAQGVIGSLVKMDIISGYNDNTFKPSESLTRAEAAKIIYLITNNL